MADTTCASYNENPIKHTVGGTERCFAHEATVAQLLDEQRFLFFKLPIGAKITRALMWFDDLDSGSGITAFAAITDGTTIKNLIGTAAAPKTTPQSGGVALVDQVDALGYVIPDNKWYAYIHLKDAPAGAQAGTIGLSLGYTTVLDNGS